MADSPAPPPVPPSSATPPDPPIRFRIGEEFGTAKRNLPPVGIVALCLAVVAVIVGVYSFFSRQKPQGSGSVDQVTWAEVTGQNSTMVAITVTLHNTGEKPLWIKHVKAQLIDADGKSFDDDAASSVDFERYFQAFPALKKGAQPPLAPESRLQPGAEQRGTVLVVFPLTKDAVEKRKSIAVNVLPYDQALPIVLTK